MEIWLDGQLRTTTSGTPAPSSSSWCARRARPAPGLRPHRAGATSRSDRTAVELRKKCYETVKRHDRGRRSRETTTPTASSCRIRWPRCSSAPSRRARRSSSTARPWASRPRTSTAVCSGKHRIEVKHASGKFIQDVVLAKERERSPSTARSGPAWPSSAWWRRARRASASRADVEEKLIENLSEDGDACNFVPAPRETVDRVLESEKLTRKAPAARQRRRARPRAAR